MFKEWWNQMPNTRNGQTIKDFIIVILLPFAAMLAITVIALVLFAFAKLVTCMI